ncbi:OmpH family outer membrane protein [Altererythrobacter sp. CAU 1778]
MHILTKPAMAAGLALAAIASPMAATPAAAQAAQRVGIVNINAVVANSTAFQTAQTQRQTTYKAQIDQATTRQNALNAQLTPLVQNLQTASQAANANQQTLQTQANQIQQIRQQGERELATILQPVELSRAYVAEQIQDQLAAAIENAASAQKVQLVLSPDTVIYAAEALNMNQAVLNELNRLIPSAQLVPPAGWMPRQIREAQAAQAAQAGAQAPAQQPVQGR